jgi:hypothetical protein
MLWWPITFSLFKREQSEYSDRKPLEQDLFIPMKSETWPGRAFVFGQVILVSLYLLLVGLWLLITGRIKAEGIGKMIPRFFRRPYAGELCDIHHDDRHCWIAVVPYGLLSDKEGASRLVVFEDNRILGPAHCGHEEIRERGGGRFSHWGAQVYFSTLDNSDPRTNGRRYHVREVLR